LHAVLFDWPLNKAHLKQPRPEFAIEHNVKAENFEADALGTRRLSRPTHAVRVEDMRVCDNHCLNDEVGDRSPDLRHVVVGAS